MLIVPLLTSVNTFQEIFSTGSYLPFYWNILVYYQKQFSMSCGVLTAVLRCTWIQCSVSWYYTFSQTTIHVCVCVCACALVCVCVGVAPHILNFDIRWRWGISFTPQAPNPQGKIPMYPLNRQLHVYMCINNIYCASALLLPLNHWRIPATERIHVTIFWIMTHCSQVDRKQGFRRTYCLCLHRRISVMMMECSIFF